MTYDCAFNEVTLYEAIEINGGGAIGNTLMLAGGIISATATGPIGVAVGVTIAVIGFCESMDW